MTDAETHRIKHALAMLADEPGVPFLFELPGQPRPKVRPRVDYGHGHSDRKNARVQARMQILIRAQSGARMRFPTGGVALVAIFFVKDRRRVDADNLEKLLEDACTKARLWVDDSMIVAKTVWVRLDKANPRTLVGVCSTRSELRG